MKHHDRYIRIAMTTCGLQGKRVLEIGGSTPLELIAWTGCRSWTSVNLNSADVERLRKSINETGVTNVEARLQDATTIDDVEQFDVVYSINAFEHIQGFGEAFRRMEKALTRSGRLFAIFGPIWSSDVGHHLSVQGDQSLLHFSQNVLEPFEHLRVSPDKMRQRLLLAHSTETVERIIEWVYSYPDINRMFESEYDEVRARSRLTTLLDIRRRGERPTPEAIGASATRDVLWLLSRCEIGLWRARLRAALGLVVGYGWARLVRP